MDFWQKARSLAEEAAKRSQELTQEAAKRSQDLTIGTSKISDLVSETAKRSKEFAAEASKRADRIKIEAIRGADRLKSIADQIPVGALSLSDSPVSTQPANFGVTDEFKEFLKGITLNTFQEFPLEDDTEMSNVPTVSNVQQDLTEWQQNHAKIVLSTVKEISKLRYELCPRIMKERKFWRIYFILVNSHIAQCEKQYMDDLKQQSSEKEGIQQVNELVHDSGSLKSDAGDETKEPKEQFKTFTSAEQELDVFLLGDHGDSDDPDDGNLSFGYDFDEIVGSSDDEKGG